MIEITQKFYLNLIIAFTITWGKIPAIAITAYAGEADYQQAIAAGFGEHITKPVEPAKLLRAIANLIYSYSDLKTNFQPLEARKRHN